MSSRCVQVQLRQGGLVTNLPLTNTFSAGAEEDEGPDKDPAKTERKERERRRDSEGQPPPIPEKVKNHCRFI